MGKQSPGWVLVLVRTRAHCHARSNAWPRSAYVAVKECARPYVACMKDT